MAFSTKVETQISTSTNFKVLALDKHPLFAPMIEIRKICLPMGFLKTSQAFFKKSGKCSKISSGKSVDWGSRITAELLLALEILFISDAKSLKHTSPSG